MAQSTEEEGSPEEESREDTRSARRAGGRVIDGRSEGRDEGAEEAFDIREQGLRGGSGQSGEAFTCRLFAMRLEKAVS